MQTYKLKTSAKCGGCTSKIDAKLKENPQSGTWKFDLADPDKTIEITTGLPLEDVIRMISEAGYKAELKK